MTDRRDSDAKELRDLLDDLESTLVELRGEVDEGRHDRPDIPRGLPGGGRPAPRPPRMREVLRFTEEYTIPTLISILEANIRLLRFSGAALRALDPEQSAIPSGGDDGAVGRALDAGRGFSTDRLASGLEELNDALAGTDAPDPEARELLSEAEELSAEIQERLRDARSGDGRSGSRREGVDDSVARDDAVHIDVEDGNEEAAGDDDSDDEAPAPDVDAELDSIREEVRGSQVDAEDAAESEESNEDGDGPDEDSDGPDEDADEDPDGTPLE